MKNIILILLCVGIYPGQFLFAQDSKFHWWDPSESGMPFLEGQAWPKEVNSFYDRFPGKAKKTVKTDVWNTSHNAAGLLLRFKTNANRITVRYQVNGGIDMPHMPATGVSGVDLYSLDANGTWQWAPGSFSFGDTITYQYQNLDGGKFYQTRGNEFRLYLPLYNTVKWLEIGVPEEADFQPLPARNDKPIVVYGTSIVQGACASRPGMAWPAILGREMGRPVINLGFSGTGKLDHSVTELIREIDAKIIILDCLPNLTLHSGHIPEEVNQRIIESVNYIREANSEVPILLAHHSGIVNQLLDTAKVKDFTNVNQVLIKAYEQLKSAGVKNVHLLSNREINLDINSTVDGVHPNDLGMQYYAMAYESSLRSILNEPIGKLSTTKPCIQFRDGYYNWELRHKELLKLNKERPPDIVFFGNSIVHYWGGEPSTSIVRGGDSWDRVLRPNGVRNFGFGWDRIENVLWRVYHGELDDFQAKKIVMMIGTNNLIVNTDQEIIEGLKVLVSAIRLRQPESPVFLTGLLPRREMEERVKILNEAIEQLADQINASFANPGTALLDAHGKLDESLFEDGLHPNGRGYWKIANELKRVGILE